MEKLIEQLRKSVEIAMRDNEDMEATSWAYQDGVLISAQDALTIIEFYDSHLLPVSGKLR